MAAGLLFGLKGAAATATTAATASTAGLFGTAGSIGAMQTFSTLGSAMSAYSAFTGGQAEYQDYSTQADWERVKQANSRVSDAQKRTAIREKLARVNAQNFATYAARGIRLEGTPMSVSEESERQAARELDITRYDTDQFVTASEGQASTLKSRGYSARARGKMAGAGKLFDLGAKAYNKGAFS